jgi:ABC transporter C-terminal domain
VHLFGDRVRAPAALTHLTACCQLQAPLRKLGFREKEEFAALEGLIDELSAKKEELERSVAAEAKKGDFMKVKELSAELERVAAAVEAKTDRWLELAERAEAAGVTSLA